MLTWSTDGRTDVRTYGQPERSMPPAGRGRGGIKRERQCKICAICSQTSSAACFFADSVKLNESQ